MVLRLSLTHPTRTGGGVKIHIRCFALLDLEDNEKPLVATPIFGTDTIHSKFRSAGHGFVWKQPFKRYRHPFMP